jgi:hypothetical protein
MSHVLILHRQDVADAIVCTSLVKRLTQDGHTVTFAGDESTNDVLRYCGCRVVPLKNFPRQNYAIAINLSPSLTCAETIGRVDADEKYGYGVDDGGLLFYNAGAELHYRAKYVRIPSTANQFQLVFGLAGLKWRGEGYDLRYYPRNRSKHTLTGVAIRDQGLRDFVFSNLSLQKTRLWRVPIKMNIRKQIDEVNRCKQIVTDDITIAHGALALRKNVEFLTSRLLPFKLEMFGAGNVHFFDNRVLKDG